MLRNFGSVVQLLASLAGWTVSVPMANAQWVAFNDHLVGPGTALRVSPYDMLSGPGGPLTNQSTGARLTAALLVTPLNGPTALGTSGYPDAGTPAYTTFNGFVDLGNNNSMIGVNASAGSAVTLTFTNLDPAKRYIFKGTSARAGDTNTNPDYLVRWTLCTLVGAAGFVDAHTSGCVTNGGPVGSLTPGQAAYNSGINRRGDMVVWENINPGSDGSISVRSEQYTGAIPGGGTANSTLYGYALCGFRLEEVGGGAPTVAITAPAAGASFAVPADILITATASDSDGIARVEFFRNGISLGQDTSSPYGLTWSNAPAGSHALTAVATDGVGLSATSAAVSITVAGLQPGTNQLVGFGADWKYLDNGSDQGTAWRAPGFDDSIWTNGPAQLGYGNGDEATVVGYGPDLNNKYITTYFRRTFTVSSAAAYNFLNLRLLYDDGAVIYLNGVEIYRTATMPSGTISFDTRSGTAPADNSIANSVGLANLLVEGTNLLAVEVHQTRPTSSDISFDLELAGVVTNSPPTVAISSPANGALFNAPANIPINVSASDSDGSVTLVEVYQNGTKVGEDATSPFTVTWSNVTIGGTYPLRAVATDNLGARATSAVVSVSVNGNLVPSVSITNPVNNSAYVLPTNIVIGATASDSDGTVSKVVFHAGGAVLGEDTTAPYGFSWTPSAAGTYQLTAAAIDNAGAANTSATIRVSILDTPPPDTLVSTGASWRYADWGADLGTAWREINYDDSGWSNGIAQLGVGDGDEATVVRLPGTNGQQVITYYFRRAFNLIDPTVYKSLAMRLVRDDGAVVYINGVEVWRRDMPAAPSVITYGTFASTTVGGTDESAWYSATAPSTMLVPGLNVVAIEVHQVNTTSSDISMEFELTGSRSNALPAVSISSPAEGTVFTEPATIDIVAAASDPDGSVTNVTFFVNGTNLFSDAVPPFGFTWQNVPLGSYQMRAVAKDVWGAAATSAPVNVLVVLSTAPLVDSFVPAPGVVSNLAQVTVNFNEPVSGVDAADLLVNGVPATGVSGSSSNFTFTFPQPIEGVVVLNWAVGHAIVDRENPPKIFAGTAAGDTARYTLVDRTAPSVAITRPAPGATLTALTTVSVAFTEPVGGVQSGDLLINGLPASGVSGSGAGPYDFTFAQPASGVTQVSWATNHGIADFAVAQNAFAGGSWSYTLDPFVGEAGVVINEIMYHPASELTAEEFVELYNTNSVAINLVGWRISGGIDFVFPAISIPARGYLVVAADLAAFQAKYPGVVNVIGNWTGRLSNSDDEVRLRNALDNTVDSVRYATEGDWAIRQRGPLDYSYRGWEWFAAHDGNAINTATGQNEGNRSLELRNPALLHDAGQNWAASLPANGTPGQANSTATNNVAPLILNVSHFPPVPRSTNSVTISARIVDETVAGTTVTLLSRPANSSSPPDFAAEPMYDDGVHNDGIAGDGIYAAVLPPQAAGTVIEFYVSAADAGGRVRTWPAAARLETGVFTNQANAQLQFDDEDYGGGMPMHRLVLTERERSELQGINRSSDAEMNATMITTDGVEAKIRHNVGVRIRGAGSRGRPTPNYRVNVPTDRRWNGLSELNFNTQYIHAQLAGSILALKSGLPAGAARAVQLRVNGVNHAPAGTPPQGNGDGAGFGTCLLIEPIGGEWAETHFPDDGNGNVYRGSIYPWTANLDYLSGGPSAYMGKGYYKTSNQSDNDWTDLINLTYALNNTNSSDYVPGVRRNANVDLFMRYFAVSIGVDYSESSMCIGVGDDYAMYRGVKDPRFQLVPHDFDTNFGEGDTGGDPNRTIWRMFTYPPNDPSQRANYLSTFMRHPEFVPVYFKELKRLCDTTMAPSEFNQLLDRSLTGWVPGNVISRMKAFNTTRVAYILSQIPSNLTVTHGLSSQNGYLYTTSPTVSLSGQANAIVTRSVKVAGSSALWTAWNATWSAGVTLQPGINRVLVQSLNSSGVAFAETSLEIWYDDGGTQGVSGTIASDTTWSAANGPYNVTANLTIPNGVTLAIAPGTTVYLGSGVTFTVASGGRLLAEGTATAPIRFTRAPGAAAVWGGLTINGGAGTPETRIAYAHFEFNGATAIHSAGGTVFLDHLTFGNTTRPYLALDGSSFVVQDCVFPTATDYFELVHGTGGIKAGGRGLFLRNYFGFAQSTSGNYNDALDFTGGNRPGEPILQLIDNVFVGSGDDLIDLDGTDAWIEGNILMHAHKNGSPDSASAISGGSDGGNTSEITVIGNIIYDCDNAAMAKQGNFYTLLNNTIVRQTRVGGTDTDAAVVCMIDEGYTEGAGMYLEGNIVYDAEKLVRGQTASIVTYTSNLMNLAWSGPGGGNVVGDPYFRYVPQLSETTSFTSWAQAQVMREWFSLRTGSPAAGAGPNGRDQGGVVPAGVSLTGEPVGTTSSTSALLTVGVVRSGSGIPAAGWPNGSGYTHYRWRLDGGLWSAETPLGTPISLSGLPGGPHYVEVVGKTDAGLYQNDALLGTNGTVTRSRTWIVNTNVLSLQISEVLALNDLAVPVGSGYPDLVELHNAGTAAVDLYGMSITDNKDQPRKYTFPPGTVLGAGQYLVLYADNDNSPPGLHLGFTLKQEGDDLYLFSPQGQLVDSVEFGLQVADLSIGRLSDGQWTLTQPSFGSANVAARIGNSGTLKINEWLAAGFSQGAGDFIELYNPDPLPVSLAGLYLSDTPESWQNLDQIAALSFVDGGSYALFLADGNGGAGANHLNFQLAAEQGQIGLFAADLTVIDWFFYGPQTNNISQGRVPNGGALIYYLTTPTPGAPNALPDVQFGTTVMLNEVLARNISVAVTNVFGLALAGKTPEWIELFNPTTNTVDLSNMSLSDGSLPHDPRKYVFPAGVSIRPRGYYVILCDGGAPASATNTGFGIKANGDIVYLYDSAGTRLDRIEYGVQANDFSIGRQPVGGTNWVLTLATPGSVNIEAALGNRMQLRFNEWMAYPSSGDDWFEIYNPGLQPVALGGLYLTDDLRIDRQTKSQIKPLSFIGTDLYGYERFIADGNPALGADHVGFRLENTGESLGLFVTTNAPIHTLTFGGQAFGVSEGNLPDGSTNRVRFPNSPSPGDANYLPLTSVVVSEVLSHSEYPLEDAIELQNVGDTPLNLAGWYLSDAKRNLRKFEITNALVIPPGGYVVFYETNFIGGRNGFNGNPDDPDSFSLDSTRGDEVYVAEAVGGVLTGYRAVVDFGAAERNVSFGRYTNSVGNVDFLAMTSRSFGQDNPDTPQEFELGTGAPNAYPRVGPIAFTEIMYHPPDLGGLDNVRDEFVELQNASTNTVTLFDPLRPTNTWRLRDGVDFDFPPNVSLVPSEYLLVVSFDPVGDTNSLAAFRAAYGITPDVRLYGPYAGKLDNGGESLKLLKPGEPVPAGQPDAGYVPFIVVERVEYDDAAPWDAGADGTGNSLQRIDPSEYGNDPNNWVAASPTPGPQATVVDTDGDGMPDVWENAYGFDLNSPFDANQDADGDGLTNLQEYQQGTHPRNTDTDLDGMGDAWEVAFGFNPAVPTDADLDADGDTVRNLQEYQRGTDPRDPSSTTLRLDVGRGSAVILSFLAVAEKAYVVEWSSSVTSGAWNPLVNFPAQRATRVQQILIDPSLATPRFYRLRTP